MNRRPIKRKAGRVAPGTGLSSRAPGAALRAGSVPQGRGAPKLRNRRVPPSQGRRRGQGVITGLAARRPAVLLKRVGAFNRAVINQKKGQRTKSSFQHPAAQHRKPEGQRRPDPVRRPFRLQRRPLPPVQQTQREARQATFLFRRGLEIQAQVHKPNRGAAPSRSRPWRTSPGSSGILTVSIDNPTARTQPEPPSAWTLHPPVAPSAPVKLAPVEKKVPKGVALQFDINSVGKPQTSMTLNERFRILKDRRSTTAQSAKASRFVTVG